MEVTRDRKIVIYFKLLFLTSQESTENYKITPSKPKNWYLSWVSN
jgi:hypothetical protein